MTAEECTIEPRRTAGELRLLAVDDEPRILRLMNAVLASAATIWWWRATARRG